MEYGKYAEPEGDQTTTTGDGEGTSRSPIGLNDGVAVEVDALMEGTQVHDTTGDVSVGDGRESRSADGRRRGTRTGLRSQTPVPKARVILTQIDQDADDKSAESDDSLYNVRSRSRSPSLGRFWNSSSKRRKLEDGRSGSESEETEMQNGAASPSAARPAKKADFMSKAAAQARLNAELREASRLNAEEEVSKMTIRSRPLNPSNETELSSALVQQSSDAVEIIKAVAKSSRNLKGTYQRKLKEAGDAIVDAIGVLATRLLSSDEVQRLQKCNERQQAEIAELRAELAQIKTDLRQRESERVPSPMQTQPITLSQEPVEPSSERATIVAMMNARFDALEVEGRLLPARNLRPQLAADKKKAGEKMAPVSVPTSGGKKKNKTSAVAPDNMKAPPAPPSPAQEGPKGGKAKQKKGLQPAVDAGPSASRKPQPLAPATASSDQQWTKVVSKRAKKKAAAKSNPQPQAKAKTRPKSGGRNLRPPRSAAVVLTLQPEAEKSGATYAKVLADAKAKVNLVELGISALQFRRAATGARVLELPGVTSSEKADKLAQVLAEKLGEGVRVTRPTKCAELRLSNLDDSVTPEEVVAAVARVGECATDQVKTGEIRLDYSGLGTVWVRCPVTAAKKVADGGRFLVGWSSAQVKLLEPRVMRCFRCLECGHVKAQCQAQVDRGGLCYRCGKPDHKAAQCSAAPHCAVCDSAGKPASHVLGSKACTTSRPRKGKKAGDGPRVSSQFSQVATKTPVARNEAAEGMALD
ncbi:uncharacterized protein LOC134650438 [Cydia amplana]|uniref:uncharacterized protein LOC134650438 n=1 Tax=Cydia amplana TaxID=1869771 RepID=UPI002FE613B1